VRALLLLVVLVLLVVAAVMLVRATAARRRERARRGGLWRLDEDSDGEMIAVYAVHPVKERLLIGAVPFAAPDFDFRIEELRSEGRAKLVALNAGRRTLGR
jgi:hypothetical protein